MRFIYDSSKGVENLKPDKRKFARTMDCVWASIYPMRIPLSSRGQLKNTMKTIAYKCLTNGAAWPFVINAP
jgi:hypothetical protein